MLILVVVFNNNVSHKNIFKKCVTKKKKKLCKAINNLTFQPGCYVAFLWVCNIQACDESSDLSNYNQSKQQWEKST